MTDYTAAEAQSGIDPIVAKYRGIIERSERHYRSWRERGRKIVKIFTEQRQETTSTAGKRRLSLLWANVSTLQPAIYQKMPHPVVSRRFKDDDSVARVATELLERCLSYTFDKAGVDTVLRAVRDDFLLVGRGQAWLRYEADIEKVTIGQPPLAIETERVADERVCVEYVAWEDFGHNISRTWSEVTEVWRKVYMDREALVDRFGEEVGKAISLDHKIEEGTAFPDPNASSARNDKATVYEIWCKPRRKVIWIAKGYDKVLDESDPLLKLENFFPCPRPAYSTISTDSLIPIPDYVYYQDQVEEIDELTVRIGALTDTLKLVGFYPSGAEDTSVAIEKALKPGVENQLIPIPSWAAFKEGGGAQGNIIWLPVDMVIQVLTACFETRKQLIDDIYQITGISDIVRGEGDPNETATAQQIKNQWGAVRIRDRQHELARFARDIARIAAEIIAERFQPETLLSMSNMKLPTEQQLQEQRQIQAIQAARQQQQAMMMQQQAPQPAPMMGAA